MRFLPLLLLAACASPRAAWPGDVARIRFTWHHLGKDLVRTYEWNLETGTVEATAGDRTEGFPAAGPGELHPAFVNDSYWFLFEHVSTTDGSHRTELGRRPVPGFPRLGERQAIEVRYDEDEGYTGGDVYVLYLGADGEPAAWAFHKGGADAPTLVTTRGKRIERAGLSLPTEFAKPDGTVVIRIEGIEVEERR